MIQEQGKDIDVDQLIASIAVEVTEKAIKREVDRLIEEEGKTIYEVVDIFFQRGREKVLRDLGIDPEQDEAEEVEYEPFNDGHGETGLYL